VVIFRFFCIEFLNCCKGIKYVCSRCFSVSFDRRCGNVPSLLVIRICNDFNPVGNWSVNNRIVRQYNFEKQVLCQVLCEYFKNTQHAYIAGSCPSNCYSNPLTFNLTSKEFSRGSSLLNVENFPCFQYWNPAETTD